MKYDYDCLKIGEILNIYYDVFGKTYKIDFSDEPEEFRDDIINCIETGTPQVFKPHAESDALRGLIPGIDYVL